VGAVTDKIIKLEMRGASGIMIYIAHYTKDCSGKPVLSGGLLDATMHLLKCDGLTIHTEIMCYSLYHDYHEMMRSSGRLKHV
jgi:hypothetical protein